MLIRMSISGFALIDSMDFEPGSGLNVVSGETGAGKSLLIDAIGALIGNRIGKESVRSGSEKAIVEGVFDRVSEVMEPNELIDFGITPDDDDLLYISREIQIAGRNIVRMNGTLVPLFILKTIGPKLLDIHGQHEQQTIFQVARHIELLDRYAGDNMTRATTEYSSILSRYKECLDEITRLGTDPAARKRRAELLRYQIDELEEARFLPGEEETLFEKKRAIATFERARSLVDEFEQIVSSEDDTSPISRLHYAESLLNDLSNISKPFRPLEERLKNILIDIDSVAIDFASRKREFERSDLSTKDIDDRLDLMFRFKNKYGGTIDEMIRYLDRAKEELDVISMSESRLKDLHGTRILLEKDLLNKALAMRELRKDASKRLSSEIVSELSELGMDGATFSVSLSERPKNRFFSKSGCDEVAFMFTANRGEPEKPLEKIVSGGEASRIMLAIKTILAQADSTPSLVFDEIDSGVSGKTSSSVATRMKELARFKQVLCVTHLAQIAAAADSNFFIVKEYHEDRTKTGIYPLNAEGKKREVARLLSGETDDRSLSLSEHLIARQDRNPK